MYPQGHGDAYGHYLSALSGYYRLLRNGFFSWGKPAMGEMVVADSVLNVDYYDEAQFAKAAYNVAKTALETVDRTARKAATGAGYLDTDGTRNFGYGEWASRGGFGALCNWAVANSILGEEPLSTRYHRHAFTGDDSMIGAEIAKSAAPLFDENGTWTLEFQVVPGEMQSEDGGVLVAVGGDGAAFSFAVDGGGGLYFSSAKTATVTNEYEISCFAYTNATKNLDLTATLSATNGLRILECTFFGARASAPSQFPDGYDVAAQLDGESGPEAPSWDGWLCSNPTDDAGARVPYRTRYVDIDYEIYDIDETVPEIVRLEPGRNYLVAIRSSGGEPTVTVFDPSGVRLASETVPLSGDVSVERALLGIGFAGEIGELRAWDGVRRTDEELLSQREYASPLSEGLALYLRTISRKGGTDRLDDEVAQSVQWTVGGGEWIEAHESGMNIGFADEGLKRIDRSTVHELSALADIVPQIQKKADQMDAGLNPLGLASSALPFDLSPINEGDGSKTHYEQIRERAETALANARKTLDKAQENASRLRLLQEAQVAQEEMLSSAELEFKNRLIEYFGYPYEGDIGPGGTYPQGYDGPDLLNYAWMEPQQFGLSADEDVKSVTTNIYIRKFSDFRAGLDVLVGNFGNTSDYATYTYEKSATGIILKPSTVSGKRRACGKTRFRTRWGIFSSPTGLSRAS